MCAQDHLLPCEYVVLMREHLLDRCPVSSPRDVRAVVEEDLGAPLERLFAHFEAAPVASASLAQVHCARGHDGRRLAVKVQHRGLRETSAVDLATIEWLVRAARLLAPDFDYSWLVEECKENLPKGERRGGTRGDGLCGVAARPPYAESSQV